MSFHAILFATYAGSAGGGPNTNFDAVTWTGSGGAS